MRFAIVIVVLAACGKGSESDGKGSASPPASTAKTPPKQDPIHSIDDAEGKAMCERLVPAALRDGFEVRGGGQTGKASVVGHLLCRFKQVGSTKLFDVAVTVRCGDQYGVEQYEKTFAPYKNKDGTSAWKPAAGPGKEARVLGPDFEIKSVEFWDDQAGCSVAIAVNHSTDLDPMKWATAIEAAFTTRPAL